MTIREQNTETFFAPARRVSPEGLQNQLDLVSHNPLIDCLMTTAGGILAVLNEERQVLCVNDALLRRFGITDSSNLFGLRLGEVVDCIHAHEKPNGCGTTRFCASCGAAIAMAVCLEHNRPEECKCILSIVDDGHGKELVLQVRAVPVDLAGQRCILVFIQDITEAERTATLDRIFHHDLSNLVYGVGGVAESLASQLTIDQEELGQLLLRLTRRLQRETDVQKALIQNGTESLSIQPEQVLVADLIAELRGILSRHPAAYGKQLKLSDIDPDLTMNTDPSLLIRALLNMLVNAFEATEMGGMVRLWVNSEQSNITFYTWNASVIPPHLTPRIFQLYFSTKEAQGRGMGTYVMKLICESCLGGRVDFISHAPQGTTFRIELPRQGLESISRH